MIVHVNKEKRKQSKYLLDCLSDGEETSVYSVKSCTISGSGENPGGKRSEGDATDDTEKYKAQLHGDQRIRALQNVVANGWRRGLRDIEEMQQHSTIARRSMLIFAI